MARVAAVKFALTSFVLAAAVAVTGVAGPGGGTATMDWSAAAHYSFTAPVNTANFTIAFSNLPAAGKSQGITFEIINGQRSSGVITYPANAKWIGGVATKPADSSLESAGRNLFVCFTRDGGTRLEIQHLGKGG